MVKAKAKRPNAIVRYWRETRTELRQTHWPSRQETMRLSQIVLGVTLAMGMFLWLMDILFSWWLGGVVASDPWRIGLSLAILVIAAVGTVLAGRRRS